MEIRHKGTGSSAPPTVCLESDSATRPGPISLCAEKTALSCQYKDRSFNEVEKLHFSRSEKRGEKPLPDAPISVIACYNQSWTLKLWKKSGEGHDLNIPFTCGTWRHGGACRMFKGAQDFSRIKTALDKKSGWVYMVLTWPTRKGSRDKVYEKLGRCFQHMRQWIKRNYSEPGEKLEYIFLAEQHRDGWPHVNVLIHLPEFQKAAENNWKALRRKVRRHAMATGFGKVFWLEPVRSDEAIAGYFVKLCQEVSKTLQAPMKAPMKFRRLRSSQGLLPPVNKDSDYTGELMQMELDVAEKMISPRLLKAAVERTEREMRREKIMIKSYEEAEEYKSGFGPYNKKTA